MAPSVFSKLIPATQGRSIYEELRGVDEPYDFQARAGLDEENLNHNFHEYDLENAEGLGVDDSHPAISERVTPSRDGRGTSRGRPPRAGGPAWHSHDEEGDNDVPASLLVEPHDDPATTPGRQRRRHGSGHRTNAIPGSLTAQAQWETTQAHQRLHSDDLFSIPPRYKDAPRTFITGVISGSAKKKAEWRWANVSNLDNFIKDVYDYYLGSGIWCILLDRALHLMFVFSSTMDLMIQIMLMVT